MAQLTADDIDLNDNQGSVHGNRDGRDIGVENGEGYIEIPVKFQDEPYRFTVDKEQIEAFVAAQSQNAPPAPTPPAEVPEVVDNQPEGWSKGRVRHTGGGIFCREWRKEREVNGETVEFVVGYDVSMRTGIGVNCWVPDDDKEVKFGGALHNHHIDDDGVSTETIVAHARDLMQSVDEGSYDDEIIW